MYLIFISMQRFNLFVVLIVISVDQCLSMSRNEIEDFKDFLEKTSQLDLVLKKGTDSDDDFDEEEPVSDHAWEESGKFEGDLILNDQQRRIIVKNVAEGLSRNGLKDTTKRWPNNVVIYFIQGEHFNGDQIKAIQQGIEDIAQASCVKFRPYKKGDRDAVVIQGSRRGCFSQVGYQGGYQILNLSGRHPAGRGCFRHGTVVHELLHTLGFYHMQSSPDRDDYIDVLWENILQPARHNFRKYNSFAVTDFGVGYDYDSVLHYSRRAFSANGQDTLVPKQRGADIGQRLGLSDKDTKKLNKMYCDADSDNSVADESETNNKPITMKADRNKPFDGHGIGYHQGKTVVIKLSPSPETYKLRDTPTFHVFDYFSKAPETLSQAEIERNRSGKEIMYPSTSQDARSYVTPQVFDPKINNEGDDSQTNRHRHEYTSGPYSFIQRTDKSNTREGPASSSDNDKENVSYDVTVDDLSEAFDRFQKMVNHHLLNPSNSPNLNMYKSNEDNNEYYKPSKIIDNGNSLSSLLTAIIKQGERMKSTVGYKDGLYENRQNDGKIDEEYKTNDKVFMNAIKTNNIKNGKLVNFYKIHNDDEGVDKRNPEDETPSYLHKQNGLYHTHKPYVTTYAQNAPLVQGYPQNTLTQMPYNYNGITYLNSNKDNDSHPRIYYNSDYRTRNGYNLPNGISHLHGYNGAKQNFKQPWHNFKGIHDYSSHGRYA